MDNMINRSEKVNKKVPIVASHTYMVSLSHSFYNCFPPGQEERSIDGWLGESARERKREIEIDT